MARALFRFGFDFTGDKRGETVGVTAFGHDLLLENPSWETRERWAGRMSPEPETVAWIAGMQPGEVFFDIGANVGRFSLLAACRGLAVVAFEPQRAQCEELRRHAANNDLAVRAYNVALSSAGGKGRLIPGRSAITFVAGGGECEAVALDAFTLAGGVYPDHVKIDVDGNEPDIIAGGLGTLARAKSVLIEIDPGAPGHDTIIPTMFTLGFEFDPAQVEACREPEGTKFAGMANHIFRRA